MNSNSSSSSSSTQTQVKIEPIGFAKSKCGYCHSTSFTSHQFGFWAHQISPEYYQKLINSGWRRSGRYVYLPYHPTTCCSPFPIRCSAKSFKPTKSQRQTLKRWKNYLIGPTAVEQATRSSSNKPFDLIDLFQEAEINPKNSDSHEFKIKLEPAQFSEEKFKLYQRYQIEIHHDPPEKISRSSFNSFLCENPFSTIPNSNSNSTSTSTSIKLPKTLGAYHASYYLDENLIGLSIFDLLPEGISSVYFLWDPKLSSLSLGKLSVLKEISWIQEDWIRLEDDLDLSTFEYYFLGYYIHSCTKMKYKSDYQPSELLNPLTKQWDSFQTWFPKLNQTDPPSFENSNKMMMIKENDRFHTHANSYFTSSTSTQMSMDELVELTKDALGEDLSKEVQWITGFDVI
ncbi:arginine-tRNA-protein transferase [Melampsora americana]|nr:arginine-tRNA-protein transferase [Melampsora americana]